MAEKSYVLELSEDELLVINNALNEVCNGLRIDDFDLRIGMPFSFAEDLLHRVGRMLDANS